MADRSRSPFLRSLQRLQLAFWQRRVAQWIVRAAWLSLLVPTIFMAGYLWFGWQVRWYQWLVPMLLVGLLSIFWSLRPIALRKVAYRLDDRLGLRAQLITAFEVSRQLDETAEADNLVVQRLIQATVDIIVRLRRQVHFLNRGLWLEMQALIGVVALFGALLLLDALTPNVPNATPVELPPIGQEPLAEEVIPPDPELAPPPFQPEIQAQASSADQVQEALEALAEALRDQAATRAAAEAIERGDLGEAAGELRRLADQLGDLSEEARQELGDSMQEAADNIDDGAPSLSEPLETGNEALEQNDLPGASQALEELAQALDEIEEAPQETAQAEGEPDQGENQDSQQSDQSQPQEGESGGAGEGDSDAGSSDQPTEDERLAIEGEPLELESEPPEEEALDEQVLQPAELDAQASEERTEDSPFARQSLNTATDLGPDPLTYPWEKREIIRRYFTP